MWRQDGDSLPIDDVIRMYNAGFAGCGKDEQAHADLLSSVQWPDADAACHAFGIADTGAGKLCLTYPAIMACYPGALPGAAQERGDCVSHSTKNAGLATMCCEIVAQKPDDVTGAVEAAPELTPEGIKSGAASSEAIYWYRGYGGDGWSCDAAAMVIKDKSGLWLRKNYPDFNVDLTTYSGSKAGLYGSRTPPDNMTQFGRQHLIRTVTEVESFEALRDLIANGYGISTCGGEGWSSRRDENGYSDRQGSWSHALACLGADDRDIIKQKYGEPLVLVQNSWAEWNSGGTRILGTNRDIPGGSFWARWSAFKNRQILAFSSFNGWRRQRLPDWGIAWG
jgi:hypothetical protein